MKQSYLTFNKAVHHCKYLLSGLVVPTRAEPALRLIFPSVTQPIFYLNYVASHAKQENFCGQIYPSSFVTYSC